MRMTATPCGNRCEGEAPTRDDVVKRHPKSVREQFPQLHQKEGQPRQACDG
jgi:hypothetical protein